MIYKGAQIKWTTFDEIYNGNIKSNFDFVFAILADMDEDELDVYNVFYQYYTTAPIFYAFVATENEDVASMLKALNG